MDGFTKGPWHIHKRSKEMTITGKIHQVTNSDCYPSAFVPAWDEPDMFEAISNAHLIAAAPDMYAVLSELLDDEYIDDMSSHMVKRIIDVLSKAEGTT